MIPATCTWNRTRVCHLQRHLTLCNKVLWHAGLQLREDSGNKLGDVSVVTVPGVCVVFPDCERCTHDGKIALSLLRWLLKRHRCIVSVAANYGAANTSRMVEALESSPRLGRLALFGNARDQEEDLEQLADTGGECPLRQGHACSANRMKIPVRLLEKAGAGLVSLDVTALNLSVTMAMKFIDALLMNRTVTELAVGGCFFTSGDLQATTAHFAEYLVKNEATLQKLTVKEPRRVFATAALHTLAQAIRAMTTLEDLDVECEAAGQDCSRFLAVVARSRSLQNLCLVLAMNDEGIVDPQPVENVDGLGVPTWVSSLKENSTLRHLELHFWWSTGEEFCILLETLANNHVLQSLTLFSLPRNCGLGEVCRRIQDRDLEQRVCIGSHAVGPEDVTTLSACLEVTAIMVNSYYFTGNAASLGNVFNVMATCHHITSLHVFLHFFDNDVFASLTGYISASPSLKVIKLFIEIVDSDDEGDEMHVDEEALRQSISSLYEALSSNSTINHISLYSSIELCDEDCQVLADAASTNRQLYELILANFGDISFGVFLSNLLPRLAENYHLLRLEILCCLGHNDQICAALDVARRNCSLVERATMFVMERDEGPECARAFELLSEQPVLVHSVLREATVTEKGDAIARIKRALQVLRWADLQTYMRLTGVVKERVVCEVQEDGSTQLDQLNTDCSVQIARYLKLADVVDP